MGQCIAFQSNCNSGVDQGFCGKLFFNRKFTIRRIHAQDQTDSQQCIGSQIGEREDELCVLRYFPESLDTQENARRRKILGKPTRIEESPHKVSSLAHLPPIKGLLSFADLSTKVTTPQRWHSLK